MLTILHGDNTLLSRNFLNHLIDQAKKKQLSVIRLTGTGFQIDNLVNALEPGLFDQKKLVIIDDFQKFSLQDQKNIAQITKKLSPQTQLVLWGNKKLSAKTLNLFPKKQDRLFRPDNKVFVFLDSLKPDNRENSLKLLDQILTKQEIGLVFHLLVGRIEDLIIIKTGHQDQLKKAPWQKSRLIKQAENFSLPTLKNFLEQLILLDYQQKTGRLFYSLEFGLELLIAKL
ncbi:MAG: hypothetical protein PHX72_00950 [Candidatus Shapirobacteria bacterium]|nr:hypothetical protein [Candidatus Shapirobacteria bacterium]